MRLRALVVLWLAGCSGADDGALVARGSVELPEVDLSVPIAARVVAVRVDEGAVVRAGDTIALLSQADLPSSLVAQRARVGMAGANLKDLEAGARPEELKRAEAELAAAGAEADRTATDLARFKSLYETEVIARQQLDNAEAATKVAAERRRVAAEALAVLRAGTRRDRVAMARSELVSAQAALAMIEARATDLVITAPVAGRILTRQAEPGEFLAPGIPAVTLGETARAYVRVYVPARRIAELAVGDTASVVVDGTGQAVGWARIVAINTKAEFTPRVALTEQERADLMFGIKLDLLGGGAAVAHPGLWVSVTLTPARARP
jgi:HlyD family secretion protein